MKTQPLEPLLNAEQRQALLAVARRSIALGLEEGRPLRVHPEDYAAELRAQRAAFVTLLEFGQLRGCIGHLEPLQPLVKDVAENAFAAAFRDPRFPPVTARELEGLHIEISVLTPATPLSFGSEQELVALIEPGRDGLILEEGHARGTFLPSVWESLPDPRGFLRQLKRKAGLPEDYWSDRLQVSRYRTESFGEKNSSS
ncbi:MAG: AmmeMemoRadiSam system protein A [Chromatiaceae bacterium]